MGFDLRKKALSNIRIENVIQKGFGQRGSITEIYGEGCLQSQTMKDYLPKPVYRS